MRTNRAAGTAHMWRILALLTLLAVGATGSASETRLRHELLSNIDRLVRPVANVSGAVQVKLGITVQSIRLRLDEDEATLNIWCNMEWTDYGLQWDPEDYDGIRDIRVLPDEIWTPDVMPFNMIPRPSLDWLAPVPLVVNSDGSILHVAPAALRVHTRRDFFVKDIIQVQVKFGSWAYDGYSLNLVTKPEVDLSSYITNDQLWALDEATVKRNSVFYTCCDEPYLDVTMTVMMSRPRHVTITPNAAVTLSLTLSLAGFVVPVSSPQKLTLPSVSLLVIGAAAGSQWAVEGGAEYRAHFTAAYVAYTYAALGCLVWAALALLVAGPRPRPLPAGLRRCLAACWLPAKADDKADGGGWPALAELLDRVVGLLYLALVVVSCVLNSVFT